MKEMTARILLGVIAIPILLVILLFPLPFNAAVNAVIMAFTALAGIETARLTETRLTRLNKAAAVFCAVLPPLSVFCFLFLPDTAAALAAAAVLILAPALLIGREAFSRSAEKWNNSLGRIAGYAFILLYIGGLSAALVGFQFLSRFVPDDNPGLIYLPSAVLLRIRRRSAPKKALPVSSAELSAALPFPSPPFLFCRSCLKTVSSGR